MQTQTLFLIVFLCQIVLISVVVARRLTTYMPRDDGRMFSASNFLMANAFVVAAGLVIIAIMASRSRSGEWDHAIATGFGLFQYLPLVVWGLARRTELKMLIEKQTIRSASLEPRRAADYLSKPLLTAAVLLYLSLFPFVAYINQFDFPWFGGYLNIAIITAMNAFFALVIWRRIYGRSVSRHRPEFVALEARVMLMVSIAATLFVMVSVTMKAFELDAYKGVAHCLYFQLLVLMCFPVTRNEFKTAELPQPHESA